MPTMTITLALPPKCLFKNSAPPASRGAKIGRSEAIKKTRGEAKLVAAQNATLPWPTGKTVVSAVFHFKDRRSNPDRQNLMHPMAPIYDGIADALGVNDRDFVTPTPEVAYGCRKLVVTVSSVVAVAQVTNSFRHCSVCGQPMVRAVQPHRIVCLKCHRKVDGVADANLYPTS